MKLAGQSSDTYAPVDLIIGDADVVTQDITVLSGQNLAANEVVGRVTASGKIMASIIGASDGSEVPLGILVNAIDASGGDLAGTIYIGGDFNEDELVWDAGYSTDLLKRKAFDGTNIKVGPLAYSEG